ncbi:hypothetical protein [Actinoplanes sp. NPDC023714]|uniref:hypothetical protein n=1 Tax=Actinoplanes sp. NPDC023714 TaxID=3154322 RepID=UPI0033DF6500
MEAREVLARLEPLGPLVATGSYVSGLMVSREIDVVMDGGPADVVPLFARAVEIPGLTGFAYDRAGDDIKVTLTVGAWRVLLSLRPDGGPDPAGWHRDLAARLTGEEREAILAIKRMWHERPEYPGADAVCTAVLEDGVRTAVEFGVWLRSPSR